jgi:hypothetical protein
LVNQCLVGLLALRHNAQIQKATVFKTPVLWSDRYRVALAGTADQSLRPLVISIPASQALS